jgi:phage-related protein
MSQNFLKQFMFCIALRKKTTATSKHDQDITAARYKAVIQERSKK